jgi:hypothetical protein
MIHRSAIFVIGPRPVAEPVAADTWSALQNTR